MIKDQKSLSALLHALCVFQTQLICPASSIIGTPRCTATLCVLRRIPPVRRALSTATLSALQPGPCIFICSSPSSCRNLAGSHGHGGVCAPSAWGMQVRKEPKEVACERKEEARAANVAVRKGQQEQNEAKKRMKGKNKPTRRQRKKQLNVIEERRGEGEHQRHLPGRPLGGCQELCAKSKVWAYQCRPALSRLFICTTTVSLGRGAPHQGRHSCEGN